MCPDPNATAGIHQWQLGLTVKKAGGTWLAQLFPGVVPTGAPKNIYGEGLGLERCLALCDGGCIVHTRVKQLL